ncbi:short-chain dehydrogenase [Colletotrichum higginsianum]|uniref:Short-chain dehydrogenase n=2 Tax=Colletotrichum higginsianum TaxID=80884 RepID=H1VZB2_COLHI|nr:Short-chain dehydrogenase [Colletotrichum higginsianum IMI 349063]OBR12741.1 Short-chain dehydrogenase [Colletotrichum higginsianum IMI 349063]TID00136.1 NADPH-dependent 1-acyldihydroxyacetone phosphate reductase [Colletotrichum higginsianum]GJC94415.1 short-chain dehydrogenase [Colletotrichum higginsianum]CCF45574.1 short-chain dehydrogenase [Colletotrichum higginsianum]
MSSPRKLNILITGCSPGGMGAALATVFHDAGHHVYATARNPSKLAPLAAQGMRTIPLDVTSASSIQTAVEAVSSSLFDGEGLDMLVNNAAGSYTMPIADVSLDAARALFDQNVWGQIAVTQAFLPLLLKSATTLTRSSSTASGGPGRAMVVNHTSVGSVTALPFQGVYNASKAALAMLSETMRLELAPFGIGVVDLKTAGVRTNIISNNNVNTRAEGLPADSIYGPAREVVEKAMSQKGLVDRGVTAEQWAAEVAALLLGKNPPAVIWKGESAMVARVASSMPCNMFEGFIKKMTKLDVVEELITESRR